MAPSLGGGGACPRSRCGLLSILFRRCLLRFLFRALRCCWLPGRASAGGGVVCFCLSDAADAVSGPSCCWVRMSLRAGWLLGDAASIASRPRWRREATSQPICSSGACSAGAAICGTCFSWAVGCVAMSLFAFSDEVSIWLSISAYGCCQKRGWSLAPTGSLGAYTKRGVLLLRARS